MKIGEAGKFVRRMRNMQGMNQIDLSEKIGTTQGALSKYERGLLDFSAEHFTKALKVLGIKIYLMQKQRKYLVKT